MNHRHLIAIGDIHGCQQALCSLLEKIGCVHASGRYLAPDDTLLVFLGDLIDRGPSSRQTVATVRAMVDGGDALCIAGNHEFNAVLYHTPNPEKPGEFVRSRDKKNNKQIAETLVSYRGHEDQLADDLAWFRTLPMALEVGGLRCVHACWDSPSLALLQRRGNAWYLPESQWIEAGTPGSALFDAIERLCKGPEAAMPDGGYYLDKDRNPRYSARVAWWQGQPRTWAERFRLPSDVHGFDPNSRCNEHPDHSTAYTLEAPPVVFGHYWLQGSPAPLTANTACLDYSAVLGGKLVAYSHVTGAQNLDAQRFIWVEA